MTALRTNASTMKIAAAINKILFPGCIHFIRLACCEAAVIVASSTQLRKEKIWEYPHEPLHDASRWLLSRTDFAVVHLMWHGCCVAFGKPAP